MSLFIPETCFEPFLPIFYGFDWIIHDEEGNFCFGERGNKLAPGEYNQMPDEELFDVLKYTISASALHLKNTGNLRSKDMAETYFDIYNL